MRAAAAQIITRADARTLNVSNYMFDNNGFTTTEEAENLSSDNYRKKSRLGV